MVRFTTIYHNSQLKLMRKLGYTMGNVRCSRSNQYTVWFSTSYVVTIERMKRQDFRFE